MFHANLYPKKALMHVHNLLIDVDNLLVCNHDD